MYCQIQGHCLHANYDCHHILARTALIMITALIMATCEDVIVTLLRTNMNIDYLRKFSTYHTGSTIRSSRNVEGAIPYAV
jgi:hypothetical protein